MLQMIYCSREAFPFSREDLAALLQQSRRQNHARDITGLLIYDSGCFFQALEGPDDLVRALIGRIRNDRRHTAFTLLSEREIAAREFGSWRMAFADAGTAMIGTPAYEDLDHVAVEFSPTGSESCKLLYMFQEGALRPPEKLAEIAEQVSVTVSHGAGAQARRDHHSSYLMEFARAIALSMPDVEVRARTSSGAPHLVFNVRRAADDDIELF